MPTDSDHQQPGLLLDVDGTLLDTNYLHVLAWSQALRDTGHGQISMAAIHQLIGRADADLVEQLLGETDEAVVEGHSQRYAALRDQVKPFRQTADLIHRAADAGLRVVLATSGKEEDLDWMLPAIGAREDLFGATTSADVKQSKPAPDLLATAAQQHGLDPARTIAIGDTVWDIRSAHNAGFRCIGFTCGGISQLQLADAGADEIHESPSDLLRHWTGSLLAGVQA